MLRMLFSCLVLIVWLHGMSPQGHAGSIAWQSDYTEAKAEAEVAKRLLLVWFFDPTEDNRRFADEVLADSEISQRIAELCVSVKVPLDATRVVDDQPQRLLAHAAFHDLHGRPGLAIIDQTDSSSPHFGRVVSIYPLDKNDLTAERMGVLLDLPPGSLTQRTLIFAVRTHRDRPASATSDMLPLLADESSQHAVHQASICLQGHHGWDQRFHSINARLPTGMVAYEVCAESWPGQTLLDAAEECVDSWRQSSGHWNQVSRRAECYGYDMRRGANGVWYAAGIFARRR